MRILLILAASAMVAAVLPAGCSKKTPPADAPVETSPPSATPGPRRTTPPPATTTSPLRRENGPTLPAESKGEAEALEAVFAAAAAQGVPAQAIEMRRQFGLEVAGVFWRGKSIEVQLAAMEPERSGKILSLGAKRSLLHQKTGTTIPAPPASAGSLALRPVAGRIGSARRYSVSFLNPDGLVKPGDKVSVSMDGFRLDDLTVR